MSTARWPVWCLSGGLAALCALPGVAHAGLYTAPTGPTYNVGPEAAWLNPAGMTGLKTNAVTMGVAGAIPVMRFDPSIAQAGGSDGGQAGVATILPSAYLVGKAGERFRLGLSILAPLGGPDGIGWDFGDNFAGRYAVERLTFASMSFGPSVAWKVNDKWSLGAGGQAYWLDIGLSTAVNTPLSPGDGKVAIDVSDWTGRYFVGTQYQFTPATALGVVYRSQWEVDLTGERTVTGIPVPNVIEPFALDLTFPQTVEVGLQHVLRKDLILGLSFNWEDWSAFDQFIVESLNNDGTSSTTIAPTNWQDTYSGGASLTFIKGQTFYNAGVTYASSPVSDANRFLLIPADESVTLNLGLSHNASKTLSYSLGGAVVFSGSAPVDKVNQGVRVKGDFSTNLSFVLGGSLQWRF